MNRCLSWKACSLAAFTTLLRLRRALTAAYQLDAAIMPLSRQ